MVVVVIIGILGAIVVPQFMSRPDQAKVTAAKIDIQAIATALEMYRLDNFHYPSTQQGLDALVKRPSGTPAARNWNPQGYLKSLPVDPWGTPYQYLNPGRAIGRRQLRLVLPGFRWRGGRRRACGRHR